MFFDEYLNDKSNCDITTLGYNFVIRKLVYSNLVSDALLMIDPLYCDGKMVVT